MALTLVSGPAAEPITVDELKSQQRILGSSEDALLAIYIAAARSACEGKLGRALINQTWAQTLDAFPSSGIGEIKLMKPLASSITSVSYVDTAGATQTMDAADYVLDSATMPGWLYPVYDTEWPDTLDTINAVTITYVCGFGASSASVPADIRMWLLLTAGFLYQNREAMDSSGKAMAIPERFCDSLLDPWRVFGV